MAPDELKLPQKEIYEAASFILPLKDEISKVIIGQQGLIDTLLTGLITGGHVLVEGVPGLAKTLAIKVLAGVIDGSFSRIQFTPDLLPADLLGTTVYNAQEHTFSIKRGPIFANLILADEINRAPAKVQSALLEAMQEGQVTIGGRTLRLPVPFLVMATQNPIEHEGTYSLSEAQMDRFMLKARVTYPCRRQEQAIMRRMAHPGITFRVDPIASLAEVLKAREWLDRIYLDTRIADYILDLVLATRPGVDLISELSARQRGVSLSCLEGLVEFGASPRASLAIVLGAKARAFIAGRAYVVPQDVKDVAFEALRHRIIPTYEAEAEGMSSDQIISFLLDNLITP